MMETPNGCRIWMEECGVDNTPMKGYDAVLL